MAVDRSRGAASCTPELNNKPPARISVMLQADRFSNHEHKVARLGEDEGLYAKQGENNEPLRQVALLLDQRI